MKNCRFCAEEIQDVATVCKHCQRDQAAAPPHTRWRLILSGLGLLVVAVVLLRVFVDDPKFAAFKAQRAAWHQKCDGWQAPADAKTTMAQTCAAELTALLATAKREGW